MTLRSGLNAQCGFADEVTWGLAVAPTVFHPLISESMTADYERIESEGIIAGARVLRSTQWSVGNVTASGDVQLELNDQSKGILLKNMFGGTSLTGPFTPADLSGNGMTVQIGVPDVNNGTVRPKTYAGCKVSSWEIGMAEGEHVTLGLSLVGRHEILHRTVADGVTTSGSPTVTSATAAFTQADVGKPISSGTAAIPANSFVGVVNSATSIGLSSSSFTNTPVNATAATSGNTFTIGLALTAASYASNLLPFTFIGGSVTIVGTAFKVSNATLAGDNGLDTDRRFVGQQAVDEPLEAALREYTGTLETEYWDNAAYTRFVDGTEAALVLTYARGTKSVVATTNVRFDGETPQIGGREVVGQSLPFKAIGSSTDASAITVTLDET
jgi:hypothetical protein